LQNLEFAQGVYQVCGIRCPAFGLTFGDGMRLKPFFLEELDSLIESHLAGMHLDSNYVARIAQQRVLDLAKAELEISVAVSLIQHHLFAIVRPSLGIGADGDDLARL